MEASVVIVMDPLVEEGCEEYIRGNWLFSHCSSVVDPDRASLEISILEDAAIIPVRLLNEPGTTSTMHLTPVCNDKCTGRQSICSVENIENRLTLFLTECGILRNRCIRSDDSKV